MAAATCTASVISSRLEPFSSASLLYALIQYGHCTACATASAISDFSRVVSAPSANTALYQSKNLSASGLLPRAIYGKRPRSAAL